MTTIELYAHGATATAKVNGQITEGAVGIPVMVFPDEDWEGINIRLVASCGDAKKNMIITDRGGCILPWECLKAGQVLKIGIDGWNNAENIRIPTIWANCGRVQASTSDSSTWEKPTPDVIDQIYAEFSMTQASVDSLEKKARDHDISISVLSDEDEKNKKAIAENEDEISNRLVRRYFSGDTPSTLNLYQGIMRTSFISDADALWGVRTGVLTLTNSSYAKIECEGYYIQPMALVRKTFDNAWVNGNVICTAKDYTKDTVTISNDVTHRSEYSLQKYAYLFNIRKDLFSTAPLTDEDIADIHSKLKVWENDANFNIDEEADGKSTNAVSNAGMVAFVNESTKMEGMKGTSETIEGMSYAFGGVKIEDGKKAPTANKEKNRLRFLFNGIGAVYAGAGSTITADPAYKFSVYLYYGYESASKSRYDRNGHAMTGADTYTLTENRYIRVQIAAKTDEDLWYTDEDGIDHLLPAGEAALSALTLNLKGEATTDAIKKLQKAIEGIGQTTQTDSVIDMVNPDYPINAVDYHKTWDDLVNSKLVERSAATIMAYDDQTNPKYPLYTYTLRASKDYMDSDYGEKPYPANPELYARKKVLITSGFHGNERGTPNFLREFVQHLIFDGNLGDILAEFDFTIIPLCNPWGYSHTMILNSTGAETYSIPSGWDGKTYPASVTVVENSNAHSMGIRYNKDAYDVNRDFSDSTYSYNGRAYGFQTEESRYVRDAFVRERYEFVIDLHQANFSNRRCGFVAMNAKPPAEVISESEYRKQLRDFFAVVVGAGIKTDRAVARRRGVDESDYKQTSFPWESSESKTFRNYGGGFSKSGKGNTLNTDHTAGFSMCLETSIRGYKYHSTDPQAMHDDNSKMYGNTFVYNEMQALLRMKER